METSPYVDFWSPHGVLRDSSTHTWLLCQLISEKIVPRMITEMGADIQRSVQYGNERVDIRLRLEKLQRCEITLTWNGSSTKLIYERNLGGNLIEVAASPGTSDSYIPAVWLNMLICLIDQHPVWY